MLVIKIIVTVAYILTGLVVYKWWAEVNSNKQPTVDEVQPVINQESTKRATSDLDFELFMYSSEMQIAVSKIGHKYQENFMKASDRKDVKEMQINLGKTQAVAEIINYIYEEGKKHSK